MEYPIMYRGAPVGTLTVTADGLYWQFSAWTDLFADGVQRLFGCSRDASECYGVFAPAGKGLSLHRRLSRHAFPDLPEKWIAGKASEGYLPWCGTVEGQTVADAMLMTQQGKVTLALPADRDPMPLAEYAPQMERITLDGREYLCLALQNGLPELQKDTQQQSDIAIQQPQERAAQKLLRQEPLPIPEPGPGFYPGPDLQERGEKQEPAPCIEAHETQISSTSSTGQ